MIRKLALVILAVSTPSLAAVVSAEVTTVSVLRDVNTFVSVSGDPFLHESDLEQVLIEGLFNEEATTALGTEVATGSAVANQSSFLNPSGFHAEGSFDASAEVFDPLEFVEAFGSSRIFWTFALDESATVRLNGFIETQEQGKASVSILGPEVEFYRFEQGGRIDLAESLVLSAGEYRFSFAMLGFAQAFDETATAASGLYAMSLGFSSTSDAPGPNPEISAAPRVYPHPAQSVVEIELRSPDQLGREVEILDALGRRVRGFGAGDLRLSWDLRNDRNGRVPDGIYFVRVGDGKSTKLAVLR